MTATTSPSVDPPSTVEAHPLDRRPAGVVALLNDSIVYASRNLSHIRQIPEKLLDVTIQPLMFVVLFAYVFGGAIAVTGGTYKEYFLSGILIQSIAFGMVGPAVAIATDAGEGVIDRFRSLPSTGTAYLLGHYLAELAGMVLAISILLITGLVVGWSTSAPLPDIVAALFLLVLFASAMIWVGTVIGLMVRTPDAVMGIAFTVVFPLTFISNAFVPIESLPPLLEHFAAWNPISVMVEAVRELFDNPTAGGTNSSWPLEHAVPVAFAYCVAILAFGVTMSMVRYRKRTAD